MHISVFETEYGMSGRGGPVVLRDSSHVLGCCVGDRVLSFWSHCGAEESGVSGFKTVSMSGTYIFSWLTHTLEYLHVCIIFFFVIFLFQVASVVCGISIMALIAANGHNGLAIFVWVYGFSLGAYSYSLKVYTYERVRARHFARAWSFVQWSQSVPILVSIPLTGNISNKIILIFTKYYFSEKNNFIITLLRRLSQ